MISLAKIRSDISFYRSGKFSEIAAVSGIAVGIILFSLMMGTVGGFLTIIGSLGLILSLACFANIEVAFYLMIILGFLVASMNRMLLDRLPLTSLILFMPCVIICLILLKGIKEKDFSWLVWHPIVYVFFLTVAYLVVQIFNPQMNSILGWVSAFWQRISSVFLLYIACYIFKDLARVRFFFKFIIGIIFITALYGCVQQWIGLFPSDRRWLYSDPHIFGLYSLPGGQLRKFSFLSDPANYGTLMASGGMGVLIMAFGPFKRTQKIILSLFAVIIFIGMSYSGTRTANLMIPAGLLLYVILTIYKRRTKILALLIGFVFLVILYAPIYGNVTLNRFRSAFNAPTEDASYNVRTIHRHMIQPYMHRYPFGGGVNTAGVPGEKYNPGHYLAGFPPDSGYFSTAMQVGWVGLIFECLFFFIVLFYCIHYFYKCRNPEIKTYYAVMATMLFSLMLGAYAQFTVSSMPQSLIFTSFVACIIKLHTFDNKESLKTNP